ncbi:alkyl hydroperoxide reductase [Pseudodesulfovibrio nedwellii]|uniref:Alkyl hydroperoxide reductase n=1 Tax=Pseudodesulfovibrio nedwellii TaxID=2973072 RepID=A0ABM8B4A5_9BACT|nr:TlpA disulfide reductase family protein [Pseudodesulfovibrio nedwellii]BDQ38676.1 alkyl hydroperoxide reductase [Pseudodesulfovibrio nedwellii]
MKKMTLIALAWVLLIAVPAQAAETFPDLSMTAKMSPAHMKYLSVTGSEFKISDIKADFVLLEVYSMYCPICQRDAPKMNTLYQELAKTGQDKQIKVLGVAAGNTPYEVEFYRKKFKVEYPLVEDPDYVQHKAVGEVGTPAFYLLDLREGRLLILFSQIGEIEDVDEFVKIVVETTEK